jgi:uncharacterized BrkB/YihY/UPF0761 family membrane protein
MQERVSWIADRRKTVQPIDVTLRFLERDRTAVGSVLGSALAFRLFLFFVPVALMFVGLLQLALTGVSARTLAEQAGIQTALATEIQEGVEQTGVDSWVALVAGAVGALWAGRSLTKVLVAAATLAWQIDPPRRTPSVRVTGAVVGLITALAIGAAIVNRVSLAAGRGLAGTSLLAVGVAYGAAWFIVSLMLPRATSDPSAVLPGAALAGLVIAGLQWFTQLYLPEKLAQASALYGSFGVTVATLGTFFLLGRVLVVASVVNAVIWERFGSIASLVFGLPGLRRLAERPTIARYVDLDQPGAEMTDQESTPSSPDE